MAKDSKAATLKRLNRIEGQVRGLARMVEDERYCIDIVTQIGAVRAALRRVEEEILRDHVAHCVDHAIRSGDKADQRRKVAELMDVMGARATRAHPNFLRASAAPLPSASASPRRSRAASAPCRNWCRRRCAPSARISSPRR